MKRTYSALLLLLASPLALAHPGEHHVGLLGGIAHLLSEPDHLALALLAVVVGAFAASALRRRIQARRQDKRQ